jgi:hypothetical protein
VIIFNFDVIAHPGPELGARVPDADGMKLWRTFHAYNRGQLGIVINEFLYDPFRKEIFETWLTRENVKASFYEAVGDSADIREDKIHRLSTAFGRADWYVDSDVDMCTRLVTKGVKCFVYANPSIILPEWHEDRAPRPWDQLAAELDRQAEVVSERNWGDMERNT